MGLNTPKSGFHNTPEYQSSGLPFVTSSSVTTAGVRIDFPKVTRAFIVRNLDTTNGLHVGFTANGVTGSNRFTVPAASSERFELRVKTLFLQSTTSTVNFSLLGELTLIDASNMPTLTGSSDGTAGGSWTAIG